MRQRDVVRIMILNPARELLLIRESFGAVRDPAQPRARPNERAPIWVMPGGGVEPGESHETAAIRELWEEAGITVDTIGPWLWSREKLLIFNERELVMNERYYLAHVPDGTTASRANLSPAEQATVHAYRWWSLADLQATTDDIAPAGLLDVLPSILEGTFPASPITLPG